MLLGDAAHTMTPVLAQGCNSGLEDAKLFSEMLQRCSGDIDRLLPAYTAARLPEITALVNINELVAQERHTLKVGHPVIWDSQISPCHCCAELLLLFEGVDQEWAAVSRGACFEAAWLSAL